MTETGNATTAPRRTMTEQEATDEAVLLLIRKTMRLQPEAYADVIKRLPEGARHALMLAENRADRVRDAVGDARLLDYPADEDEDGDEA